VADHHTDTDTTPHKTLETRILRGSIWMALGFGSRQIATWLSMLVLARLLEPNAFGLVALAFAIISAVEYLRGAGVWSAIVHRRTEIEEAAASALVYWVISSFAIYGVCFVLAPYFASLFHAESLVGVLRVLAVVTIFGALSGVPSAILERDLAYARNAFVDLLAVAAQVVTTIGLAIAGAGVWSLVAGQIVVHAVECAGLWYVVPWRPSVRKASWSMLRQLSKYARFAGVWNFAIFVSGTADTIVVGRVLGAGPVGFYNVAFRLATSADTVLNNVILRGMFPAFSMVHQNPEALHRTFVRHMQRMVLIVLPVSLFLVVAASPIVLALLGDKWSSIVTPVRLLALAGFVSSLSATASAVFRGTGRPELAMRYAVTNAALLIPALIVMTKIWGLDGAAIAVLACLTCTAVPALIRTVRLVGVSGSELAKSTWPGIICSGILGVVLAALLAATATDRPVVSLIVLLAGGVSSYLASTALFARSVVVPMWLDLRGTRP
jgi:PST family polysaccharide transporter